jgi:hypothetical protein
MILFVSSQHGPLAFISDCLLITFLIVGFLFSSSFFLPQSAVNATHNVTTVQGLLGTFIKPTSSLSMAHRVSSAEQVVHRLVMVIRLPSAVEPL